MAVYDVDDPEHSRLPFLLWVILLFQARAWLLLIMAGASRQQGDQLLSLLVPDNQTLYIGLLIGLPALLAIVLTGYRQRFPRLWGRWRYLLWLSGGAMLAWQASQWNEQALEQSPFLLLFTLFDLLTELALLFMRPLRNCFTQQKWIAD